MFDLVLIERVLVQGEHDSECMMRSGDVLDDAASARAEFAKLRKSMEGAIERDVIEGNAGAHGFHVVHVPSQWAGHRVLLVKHDE